MKRWKTTEGREIENEKIDAFLVEVIEVSRRHGLSIGHEDSHGGFLVHEFTQDNADWLMAAADETSTESMGEADGEAAGIVETPKCEVCGAEAVVQVWDMQKRSDFSLGLIKVEPLGPAHFFCATHERDSMEFEGPPIDRPTEPRK